MGRDKISQVEENSPEGNRHIKEFQAMNGRILVIDDDEAMLSMITDYLESVGFEVQGFRSGVKAIEVLKGHERPFDIDVVVTDVNMPGLSGLDLLKSLQVVRPDLPVILISAFGGEKMTRTAQAQGAFQFLSKPFSLSELNQAVIAAISKTA